MTSHEILLQSVTLADGASRDLLVRDGFLADPATASPHAQVIDCAGLVALPGFVDLHTHLRQPGFEASETVLTGSRAAALGGFTAVHAMANTNPVADHAAIVEQVYDLGAAAGLVAVHPIGAVTVGLAGEQLADIGGMAASRANVRIFSDDGKCVFDPLLMRRALEYVGGFGGVIAQHAQDPRLTEGAQMNDGLVSAELGLTGWPGVAEESIIARDVMLAESAKARLHVCHVSTARSVEVIRWAKARGIAVTAEVTPHHLLLTDELARTYDPVYKVNPPLRTAADVAALRAALVDGTIDIVATDHAPHAAELKDCEWDSAAFGMLGLETAASIVQSVLIDSGASNWERLAEVLSVAPAKIAGHADQGQPLQAGAPANLTLIDPTARRRIAAAGASKSQNNPFAGLELPGRVVHTIYRGAFTVMDGELVGAGR